ncbi:ribonuclease P protein component [Hyphomicrobium sulfonivorans]|uniref:ribonuclease P protein component n=1 Tax=Hyphomicrobium sulfonivorans TaxID=121290 RepID=UPI001FD9083E|nr:ribonuclease P protein component [Hyphomicrobium sulfonivorans]
MEQALQQSLCVVLSGFCAVAPPTIKKRREFLWVRNGRRHSAAAFVVEARARQNVAGADAEARFGYTVSKKVGGAVVRNRVRRRLRALTAALAPEQTLPGFDYVLIARSAAVERDFTALKNDLDVALARVHQPSGQKRRGSKNP